MEVVLPITGNTMDSYEDMFKEITRKLYGEDGLPEFIPNDRLLNPQDRISVVDYDVESALLKQDEHITAFGLATLMQNGFSTGGILNSPTPQPKPTQTYDDKWIISEDNLPWSHSKVASYNPAQKLFRCAECDCVGYLPRVAEHWLGTHSNLRVFQCPQCPYESAWARCVRMHLTRHHNISAEETSEALLKNNPVLLEVTRYLQRLKTRLETNCVKTQTTATQSIDFQNNGTTIANSNTRNTTEQVIPPLETTSPTKRYSCTYCPYATDRRDLFTRHENIHREEKPFQCYVCQKQFNRADHVKKHFLRMHREHPYDLNRIRRHPPKNASGMSFYHKYNATDSPLQSPESLNSELTLMNTSLNIPTSFNNITRVPITTRTCNSVDSKSQNGKLNLLGKGPLRKRGEKRFSCCYCSWSGVDNWCLKRHMNTHLKPFVCALCDYKAARSERLATHVLKVHNKRACSKCNYLADDSMQLITHQQEQHALVQRNGRSTSNVAQSVPIASSTPSATPTMLFSQTQPTIKTYELNTAPIVQHNDRPIHQDTKQWKSHGPKQHGAARLFNYLEASDGSEPESDSITVEDVKVQLSHRIQSDFPEAGDVGSQPDELEEDAELPLFVCKLCGCEFEDDASLETHQYIHLHNQSSPAKAKDVKINVKQKYKYQCSICQENFLSQSAIIKHMSYHASDPSEFCNTSDAHDKDALNKRARKQSSPKKVVLPFLGSDDIQLLWNPKSKFWHQGNNFTNRLYNKYMLRLITRKGYSCKLCRHHYLTQFHTKGRLILHQILRHPNKQRFQCEHCNLRFRHRYQVILHASRMHIQKNEFDRYSEREPIVSTPMSLMDNITTTFLPTVSNLLTTETPGTSTNLHKIGMPVFDHSFLYSNGHIPIIIPTFPPA